MTKASSATRRTVAGRSIRWDETRAADARRRGLWTDETLAEHIARAARETPKRALLVEGARETDCATLYAEATALARRLLAEAPAGSVVSFMLPNWTEAAVIYLAATIAGMVAHPILPSLREHDLRFALEDSASRFIFIPSTFRGHDYAAMLSRVAASMPEPPRIIVVRGEAGEHAAYNDYIAPGAEGALPKVDPDSVRMLLYTSGTTGRPKGVLHTHNTLNALVRQIAEHWLVEPGDAFLVASPVSHIGGSIYAFECPLLVGATAILMEKWDADDAVRLAARRRWTHMAGATPFLTQLLAAARADGTRLPDLKVFICGGASVPPALIRDAAQYFEKARVSRVYGSTEAPVTTVGSFGPDDLVSASETDGRPGVATVRIAPHPAAPPGEGEIAIKGPQVFVGYHHAEDEANAFDADGWFRSGDLGRLTETGAVVVTGRAKDIIIRNGENIAPKEVEDILVRHPDVAEIAIVGLPDPRTGERACAAIVPAAGARPDLATLRTYLEGVGLARFKIPEEVVLREALPRNDAGKVLKDRLRAAILAEKAG